MNRNFCFPHLSGREHPTEQGWKDLLSPTDKAPWGMRLSHNKAAPA